MKVYIVTTSYLNDNRNSDEHAALQQPMTFGSLYKARKYIHKFGKWNDTPKLIRRVTPKHVVAKVEKKNRYPPMCLATYYGKLTIAFTEKDIWFAIYQGVI